MEHVVYFSPRWHAILGRPEPTGDEDPSVWFDLVHGDDVLRLRAAIDAHVAEARAALDDLYATDTDGWIQYSAPEWAQKVVKAIEAIGPEMIVLSTDYGWNSELPRPAAGLHEYVDALQPTFELDEEQALASADEVTSFVDAPPEDPELDW